MTSLKWSGGLRPPKKQKALTKIYVMNNICQNSQQYFMLGRMKERIMICANRTFCYMVPVDVLCVTVCRANKSGRSDSWYCWEAVKLGLTTAVTAAGIICLHSLPAHRWSFALECGSRNCSFITFVTSNLYKWASFTCVVPERGDK